ncbi:hypothetical protein Tco_0795900 [Tanacetum coccineum]
MSCRLSRYAVFGIKKTIGLVLLILCLFADLDTASRFKTIEDKVYRLRHTMNWMQERPSGMPILQTYKTLYRRAYCVFGGNRIEFMIWSDITKGFDVKRFEAIEKLVVIVEQADLRRPMGLKGKGLMTKKGNRRGTEPC